MMNKLVLLLLLLLLSFSFGTSTGMFCYFCTSRRKLTSENCDLYARCPRSSPGCVTLDVEEPGYGAVIRSCSFPEKCNFTVASYRNTQNFRLLSCSYCEGNLCNSLSAKIIQHFSSVFISIVALRLLF